MSDFSKYLIATDLDGTFLGRRSDLVERNLDAVERFKAGGGRFTAATGRIHLDMLRLIPQAAELFNAPGILGNGSYLYDFGTGTSFCETLLEPRLTMDFIRYVQALDPNVGVRLSASVGFLMDAARMTPHMQRDASHPGRRHDSLIMPLDEWPVYDADVKLYKMVVRGSAEDLSRLRPTVEAAFGDAFTYTSSSPEFFEVQAAGCDKGTGLVRLSALCGERDGYRRVTVAAGNHENDLPMIRAADLSACPSDALPKIIPECTWVLGPYADGCIADLIERLEEPGNDARMTI